MSLGDVVRFALGALLGSRQRSLLMLLAMAIGVASVVLLISLGEGARRYVIDQFSSLGTNLLIVLPGRSETTGGPPPLLGATPRDLTLEDALALGRSSSIHRIAPLSLGSAPISRGAREREVPILGSTDELYWVRHLSLSQGSFLPGGDPRKAEALCVLGAKVREELFGSENALGQWVRIGDRRFRVMAILAQKGQSIGTDIDEVAIIPLAAAQALFNTRGLFRILVQARDRESVSRAKTAIRDIIAERHEGEEDITVITQDAVLSTFDRILHALTLTVAGIAAISLVVAGILVMNVMLVAVSQRTPEIGLLKAVGAERRQILWLFLMEAVLLSLAGAGLGLILASAGTWFLGRLFPSFPLDPPLWSLAAALGVALLTGLGFGVAPARRAANLAPVLALWRR